MTNTKRYLASLVLSLISLAVVLGYASVAQAAPKHTILVSAVSEQVESVRGCGKNASIATTVKLRKGHNASDLMVQVYVGKTYKGTRALDVPIEGKTKVRFITCLPYKWLFNQNTGAYYATKFQLITMPRSRDMMTSTIKQFSEDY